MRHESLTLKRMTLHELSIPFRLSFRHAAAVRKRADVTLIVLESDSGHVGYGECHTREYVTGETPAGALDDLVKLWWPAMKGLTLSSHASPREALARFYDEADRTGRLAAYGAIDVAVFDLWARAFAVPGRRLFGAEAATSTPVSAPIGLGMPPTVMATMYKLLGFKDFKAKVGDAKDLERLTAIRLAIGEGSRLRIDANGVWTPESTRLHAKVLKSLRLESLEQPLAKAKIAELAQLAREVDLPLMADESLCTRADAQALLAANDRVLWNIRVGKVGGFSGALAMLDLAKSKQVTYQLGALVGESSLLTSATRALLSVARPFVVESSFPKILLAADPFHGGPAAFSPKATTLGMEPGLGVKLKAGVLTRFARKSTVLD